MADDFPAGTVWLVGAGPGDPDLLTRKAERLLRAASVVFYDALVGPGVLALAPRDVRLVGVGKRSGRHSKDQRTIDALLVAAALAGERVVRLKGGDPAIFARAAEELDACRRAGVPVRICPGVTAASAAAADLGISLTLRGVARKLTFVTAHARAGEALDLDWAALADPQATLVIYMGKAAAREVSARLIEGGAAWWHASGDRRERQPAEPALFHHAAGSSASSRAHGAWRRGGTDPYWRGRLPGLVWESGYGTYGITTGWITSSNELK